MERIDVGVLGATGMVGQQFVSRLACHPWFNLTWLAASERSEGKTYKGVAPWRLSVPIPAEVRDRVVESCTPGRGPRVVFSGLDASVAGEHDEPPEADADWAEVIERVRAAAIDVLAAAPTSATVTVRILPRTRDLVATMLLSSGDQVTQQEFRRQPEP